MSEGPKKRGVGKDFIQREQVESREEEEEVNESNSKESWARADEATISQRRIIKVKKAGSQPEASIPAEIESKTTEKATPEKPTEKTRTETENGTEKEVTTATTTTEKGTDKEPAKTEKASPSGDAKSSNPFASFKFSFTEAPKFPAFSFSSTPSFSFSTSFSFSSAATGSLTSPAGATTSIFGTNIAAPKEKTDAPKEETDQDAEAEVPIAPAANLPPPAEVKTGEEDEEHLFQTRAKLYVLDKSSQWKERGVGMFRINQSKSSSLIRLLMRVEGALRLILNVSLWPEMKLERVGDKAVRFVAPSLEGKTGEFCNYLIRVGKPDTLESLIKGIEDSKEKLKKEEKKSE